MSEQSDKANALVRAKLGGTAADELTKASGFVPSVLPGGVDGGGDAPVDQRPRLDLPGWGKSITQFAREVGATMREGDIFRRAKVILTVNPETGEMERVTDKHFQTLAEKYACMTKSYQSKKGIEQEVVSMTKDCAGTVLQTDEFVYAIRQIDKVNQVRRPVMRADGRVALLEQGYDPESRIYTLPSDVVINEEMTWEQGVALIRGYLKSFPFVDDRSLAVQVALMLSMFAEGMLPPLAQRISGIVRGNSVGTGKSLLAQMAIIPCWGVAETTPWEKDEELRKNLDSAAMQNAPFVFFDNMEGHLKSKLVDAFITGPRWGGRVMGTQQRFKCEKTTVLIITGNNLTVSPDIERRALLCNLAIKEFDLRDRHHEKVLDPEGLADPQVRGEMLSALWAIVRHWDAKGRPGAGPDPKRPMELASFEKWSRMFGGMVQVAGFGNPLVAPSEDTSAGSESKDLRKLVTLMADAMIKPMKRIEVRFQDIVDMLHDNELLTWMMTKGKIVEVGGTEETEGEQQYRCVPSEMSALGKLLEKKLCDKQLTLADGRKVRFDKQGNHRHRRYFVELME